MIKKKSDQANLERYKVTYRQMGIILALGLIFIAFEYTNADISDADYESSPEVIVEMEHVPITKPKTPDLPKPPAVIFDKLVIDLFNETPDEDIIIISMEDDYEPEDFQFPEEVEEDPDRVYVFVDKKPQFPGGDVALMRFLSKNIVYPSIAQEMGIQGKVFVEFVVNKNGDIINITILKGVDRSLDAEALRVVKKMPQWEAGSQNGKTVNVSYRLPISFRLN